jgi:hypothetical protein
MISKVELEGEKLGMEGFSWESEWDQKDMIRILRWKERRKAKRNKKNKGLVEMKIQGLDWAMLIYM